MCTITLASGKGSRTLTAEKLRAGTSILAVAIAARCDACTLKPAS